MRAHNSRRAAQIIARATAWLLTAFIAGCGQPDAPFGSGAFPSHRSAVPPRRQKYPAEAYQRAREYHIRTWGMAPGQQTMALPNTFPVTRWSPIGPARITNPLNVSGRINSIALHPTDSTTIYVAAAEGGVWKNTPGGWLPLTDDQCALSMGSVVVDPVNPSIVYAGTGDPAPTSGIPPGCGVLRSTDGGTTWTLITGSTFPAQEVARLFIDPATAGSTTTTKIFAATSAGLLRSTDSGSTWTKVLSANPQVSDVVIDPSDSQVVYGAIGAFNGNAANGIYKSTDGGATFAKLAGFPTTNAGRIKLDVASSSPSTLYAAVQDASSSTRPLLGIFKSTNGGSSWSQVATSPCGGRADYHLTINVDPSNANTIYVGCLGLFKSTSGGASYIDITGDLHVDFHAFAFAPGNPSTIYAGNDGGIFKSTNGGTSWTSLNTSLAITQFNKGGALHPTNPDIALAGTQDNSTIKYSGFATWDPIPRAFQNFGDACDGGFAAIDQTNPTTMYATCQQSVPMRSDGGDFISKGNGLTLFERFAFFPPLVMSPLNSQTLYFGTEKMYKTTDRGENWIASATTFGPRVITRIAPAPSNGNVIYVATENGFVFKSTDGNASYTQASNGLFAQGPSDLVVHPTDPNKVFLTIAGFTTTPIFKTVDGGANWTIVSSNLPSIPVNALVIDPSDPDNKVLVGTDLGVYGTMDGGATWAPAGVGLPNVIVADLKYNPATAALIAFTHGRGAWKATLAGGVASHDFNGEARSDIAWRDSSGGVALWMMNGAQVVQSGKIAHVPTSWQIVGQRDFDGDAKHDLLWRDASTGTVAIWLLSGLQVLQTRSFGSVDSSWTVAGTADFNGDGNGDILWRNTSGAVAIWQMQGLRIAQIAGLGGVPPVWVIAGTGDFNGDGKADILWRNSSSGLVAIWFLNGLQVVSSGGIAVVPTTWSIVGTGDFDGDGHSDILWRESGTGNIAVWLLNGLQIANSGTLGQVPSDWIVAETGDFDGEGKSDILWRNTTTGDTAIWFLRGTRVTSTASLGTVGTDWTIQGVNVD